MSHSSLIETLKKGLKAKNITYSDLAKRLNMTESGVKKLFTAKDISLGKLIAISDAIEIPLANLMRLAQTDTIEEVELTEHQEEELARDPNLFRFFWRLAVERLSVAESSKRESLNSKTTQTYLKKLSEIELIHIKADNRIQLVHKGLYRWVSQGPLLSKLNREWSDLTLKRSLQLNPQETKGCHRLMYIPLTERSATDLVNALTRLLEDFSRRSERETLSHPSQKILPVTLALGVVPQGFMD